MRDGHRKYFKTYGLVLKRVNLGETDQIIHFLSQDQGHFSAVAKGVRKLSSKKLGSLEPGSLVEAYFVSTKGLPVLTQLGRKKQAVDVSLLDLKQLKLLFQLLEVFERLFVAESLDQTSFELVLKLRQTALEPNPRRLSIKRDLANLIAHLGFVHPKQTEFKSLSAYIESLTEKELKSARFLTIN